MACCEWKRDLPDFRDYTLDHAEIKSVFVGLEPPTQTARLPNQVDLSEFFRPAVRSDRVVCQSAVACLALFESLQRRVFGETSPCSSLFVAKSAHQLVGAPCDADLDLRTTLKALVRFGAPPRRLFRATAGNRRTEPAPFLYGFSDRFASVRYLRVQNPGNSGRETLHRIKAFLSAGFPVVFGFATPSSMTRDAEIPFRPTFDSVVGGAAAVALGYDDHHRHTSVGALRIRGCWGPDWGEAGLGWLPYRYVEHDLAADFWTACSPQWMDSGEFTQPPLPEFVDEAATYPT